MNAKNYIKKTLIKNELSTAEAKAERLKRIRNLANLTRKEMCDFSHINLNTYKGWELGRYGGLPVDGAEKIVNQVLKSGVICTSDWLLYGIEPLPTLASTNKNQLVQEEPASTTLLSLIEKEFSIFQGAYKDAVLEQIVDDSLLPNFNKGNYVAGIKKYKDEIELVIDELCIVQTSEGKKLIRLLKKGSSKGRFTLISLNPLFKGEDLVVLDAKLVFAAPILRYYVAE